MVIKLGLASKKIFLLNPDDIELAIKWFIYSAVHEMAHAQQHKDGVFESLVKAGRGISYKDKPVEVDARQRVKDAKYSFDPTYEILIQNFKDYIYSN